MFAGISTFGRGLGIHNLGFVVLRGTLDGIGWFYAID